MYRQFAAAKCFLHRFVTESVLHLSLPPKTSNLRESHDPTQPGPSGYAAAFTSLVVDSVVDVKNLCKKP